MIDRIKRAEKSGFLSLKDYGLEEIPAEVFALTGLKTLILSNNPLKSVSKEIGALKSLKVLQMTDCGLFDDSIPEEITSLPLEELTLSSNGLTTFELLTKLTTLKRLNLAGNDIVEIPVSVKPTYQAKTAEESRVSELVQEQHIRHITGHGRVERRQTIGILLLTQNLTHNPVDEDQLAKLAKKTALVNSINQ